MTLNTMQPHMHLRGKDMTYVAKYPDGHEEILLSVPKYDFNWQNTYIPTKPYKLPAGTVLETVGHYDNSVRNRVNPMPNRPARSRLPPPRRITFTCTSGTRCCSMIQTGTPFDSVVF